MFTRIPYDDGNLTLEDDIKIADPNLPGSKCYLLACYDVNFDDKGCMIDYKRIDISKKADGMKWFAYVTHGGNAPYHNGQAYVDTLDKRAIQDFINITHKRYKSHFEKDFGSVIPAIFTDEPHFGYQGGSFEEPPKDTITQIAYTPGLIDFYKELYGDDVRDILPELFLSLSDGRQSTARYRYHDAVAEMFAQAYADQIGDWCNKNNLHMTGHLIEEPTLRQQTYSIGDAMRSYRSFTLPGIDMLFNNLELTTAKQCQSAVHQYGREGMASELYGVTGWKFDFIGHKYQGDWQAALGVTVRVPHLFWFTMSGEGKRDYPASIGYQAPWYKEYKYIENHFARVATALTRGKPVVNIGVIHPIESYWLACGPMAQTRFIREDLEQKFDQMINWLLDETLDFDYICESTLKNQFTGVENGFGVGQMNYSAIVVPSLMTIRSSTLDALEQFIDNGGKVIFVGSIPEYVDAIKTDRAINLAKRAVSIPWIKNHVISNLEDERVITVSGASPVVYQLRNDGDRAYLFICKKEECANVHEEWLARRVVKIKGEWEIDLLDTLTGERKPLKIWHEKGNTLFNWVGGQYDSVLIDIHNGTRTDGFVFNSKCYEHLSYLAGEAEFTLSEPNVLLLDFPKYSVNGEPLSEPNEILRVDTIIRNKLNMRTRSDGMAQPWVNPISTETIANVKLVFDIESDIEYSGAQLAMESLQYSKVTFNGQSVPTIKTGYYIDEDSIHTIAMPNIKKGMNRLEIDIDFCDACEIESYYLLGDFGVELKGRKTKIVPLAKTLSFGSVVHQTLPFYGANITYHFKYNGKLDQAIEVQKYCGAAISVDIDGKRVEGLIANTLPRIHVVNEEDCEHSIDITLYGNRTNTLNALHNTLHKYASNYGPHIWHPGDGQFTYEYEVTDFGIMTTPRFWSE